MPTKRQIISTCSECVEGKQARWDEEHGGRSPDLDEWSLFHKGTTGQNPGKDKEAVTRALDHREKKEGTDRKGQVQKRWGRTKGDKSEDFVEDSGLCSAGWKSLVWDLGLLQPFVKSGKATVPLNRHNPRDFSHRTAASWLPLRVQHTLDGSWHYRQQRKWQGSGSDLSLGYDN